MAISQYDLTNYAQYKPLSTQEIWAPSQAMRQQHDQLQEEYANAEQAAQQGFSGLNPEVDKEALAIHKQFMDQTKAAADELATKGFIDSGRRRSLLKLKSVYTNQVAPLQQQIELRASRNEELRKMQLQDPTFRATANPNQVSLVSGLKNPNAFDYDGVSGNQLYSSVAKKAEQLSKVISQEHPKLMSSGIFANYFTALQSGASLDQIDKAMKSGGRYNPHDVDKMTQMLHGIVGSTMNEFGVPSKFAGNEAVQQDLWNAAAQGLYSAAGTKQFGQMQDDMALYNRKKALETPAYTPEYPNRDTSYEPAITDSKRYSEISQKKKNIDFTNYKPTKDFKKTKEWFDFEKKTEENRRAGMSTTSGGTGGKSVPWPNLKAPDGYSLYQNSKRIEEESKKRSTKTIGELKKSFDNELENMRKMSATRYIDDNNDEAKKHFLSNIASNPQQAKIVEDQTGMTPQELMNDPKELNLVRFGNNARKGLVIEYRKSPDNIKTARLDYSMSGNPAHSNLIKVNNAYSNAYEGKLTGNDLVSTGHFSKVGNKYVMNTITDSKGNPVYLTEKEISEGLSNNLVKGIFDAMLNKIDNDVSSNAWSNIKAKQTEVGGNK